MILSRPAPSSPTFTGRHRFGGVGVVVGIHVLAVWALSAAFLRQPPAPPNKPTLRTFDEPKPEVPKTKIPVAEPTLAPVTLDIIPPPQPLVDNSAPQRTELATESPAAVQATSGSLPAFGAGSQESAPPARNPAASAGNGPVCEVMPKPDLPALNWTGHAVLKAQAVVRGSQLVSASVQVTQGVMDARTKRALVHAVESALAGYRCPGDQRFEQEFSITVD